MDVVFEADIDLLTLIAPQRIRCARGAIVATKEQRGVVLTTRVTPQGRLVVSAAKREPVRE